GIGLPEPVLGGLGALLQRGQLAAGLGELALELGLAVDQRQRRRALGGELAHRLVELAGELLVGLLGARGELLLELGDPRLRGLRALLDLAHARRTRAGPGLGLL